MILVINSKTNQIQNELKDYKLFCFNAKVKIILVCSNRFEQLKKTFFDKDWNVINVYEGKHEIDKTIQKPINFEKMKLLAQKLAQNMKFVRIDFYEVDKKLFFGEITLYPNSGYEKFSPEKYNNLLGKWIEI